MNIETLNQIGGALQRIQALGEKKILESSDAGERRAQEAFVKDTLYANASELCGAWITIQNNYKPLVAGFTALLRTSLAIINREEGIANTASEAKAADPATPPEPSAEASSEAPNNIIALK